MRAINHALTGAIIGLSVSDPVIAAPASFVSHFAMDALPHFGDKGNHQHIHSFVFKLLLVADVILCFALVVVLAIIRPVRWPMAILCAFLAASPDLFSFNSFYRQVIKKISWSPGRFSRFAHRIQWFEKPIGAVVEISWFIAAIICLSIFLHS